MLLKLIRRAISLQASTARYRVPSLSAKMARPTVPGLGRDVHDRLAGWFLQSSGSRPQRGRADNGADTNLHGYSRSGQYWYYFKL